MKSTTQTDLKQLLREYAVDPQLRDAVIANAPSKGDLRLEGWYQTVELGNGLCSKGRVDLRGTVDQQLPESLEGKTALDLGTCDGFWAFEMEERGAEVTALDVETFRDFDWLPSVKESRPESWMGKNFWLAHALRGSSVKREVCSVYDLSPDLGMFDVVFCGSLIMHLQNPLKALLNIRSVTKEKAIIVTSLSRELEEIAPDKPLAYFGHRWHDLELGNQLGAACIYWKFNTKGLREVMEYAGFPHTESLEPVRLTPMNAVCAAVVGYP
jgi:SAM-dependent methyltransferase